MIPTATQDGDMTLHESLLEDLRLNKDHQEEADT